MFPILEIQWLNGCGQYLNLFVLIFEMDVHVPPDFRFQEHGRG